VISNQCLEDISAPRCFEIAHLFVDVSGPGLIRAAALKKMAKDRIVFVLANPVPEIMPEEAAPYARIIATGRSDYPNQIVSGHRAGRGQGRRVSECLPARRACVSHLRTPAAGNK
jgi:malate dehydrogenase (oxaloacetate-decarboxylating)